VWSRGQLQLTTDRIEGLARELYTAERSAQVIPPISERFPDMTAHEAYAVQEAWARLRLGAGGRRVGRKIGCTSKAIQELFGIDVPDYGQIFEDMMVADSGDVQRAELVQPMVEPELAFLLREDLRGPGVRTEEVAAAIASVHACIEIIDSRIDDWRIRFVDTVADNGSSARCIVGPAIKPREQGYSDVIATLRKNGEVVGTATGEAVLGEPIAAVAWLANVLGEMGTVLRAGEYVLSGSFTVADRAEVGDRYEATFTEIGSVSCTFGGAL